MFSDRKVLFIFADLAGHFEAFQKLLLKAPKGALIIVLGDVNDKGPDSAQIIAFLISRPDIIWIMGNHEQMMIKCYEQAMGDMSSAKKFDPFMWLYVSGGLTTLKSYGIDVKMPKVYDDRELTCYEFKKHYHRLFKAQMSYEINELKNSDEVLYSISQISKLPKDHIEHMKKLPVFFTNDDLFCSHAPLLQENIPQFLSISAMDQNEEILDKGVLWNTKVPKRIRSDKKFAVYGHMNMKQVYCHTPSTAKGTYSKDNTILPNTFAVCFDLTSEASLLGALEWPAKVIHLESVKWED